MHKLIKTILLSSICFTLSACKTYEVVEFKRYYWANTNEVVTVVMPKDWERFIVPADDGQPKRMIVRQDYSKIEEVSSDEDNRQTN